MSLQAVQIAEVPIDAGRNRRRDRNKADASVPQRNKVLGCLIARSMIVADDIIAINFRHITIEQDKGHFLPLKLLKHTHTPILHRRNKMILLPLYGVIARIDNDAGNTPAQELLKVIALQRPVKLRVSEAER